MGSGVSQRNGEGCPRLQPRGSAKTISRLSEEFLAYSFKVILCNRKYSHDWAGCPCGHRGERATRRDLRQHNYLPIACKHAKQKQECPSGDNCPHAHNLFEYWLHPKRFRTEMCMFRAKCDRPVCFFAHSMQELRELESSLPPTELCWDQQLVRCYGCGRHCRWSVAARIQLQLYLPPGKQQCTCHECC